MGQRALRGSRVSGARRVLLVIAALGLLPVLASVSVLPVLGFVAVGVAGAQYPPAPPCATAGPGCVTFGPTGIVPSSSTGNGASDTGNVEPVPVRDADPSAAQTTRSVPDAGDGSDAGEGSTAPRDGSPSTTARNPTDSPRDGSASLSPPGSVADPTVKQAPARAEPDGRDGVHIGAIAAIVSLLLVVFCGAAVVGLTRRSS